MFGLVFRFLAQNAPSPLNPNDHLYSQRKAFHSPQSGARLPSSFLTAISPWIKAVAALRCSIRRPHCPSPSLPTKAHRQRQRTQKPKPPAPALRIPFSYSSLSLASKPFSSASRSPLRTPVRRVCLPPHAFAVVYSPFYHSTNPS